MRRAWIVLSAALAVASASSVAEAQRKKKDPAQEERERKEAQARAHYEKGVTHYNLGEFDEAIAEFKRAYAISGAPGLLFNIAQAYRLKKDYEQALYFYKTYLRLEPDAPNRADVEARVAEMEKLIEEQKRVGQSPPRGTIPPGGHQSDDVGATGGGATAGDATGGAGGGAAAGGGATAGDATGGAAAGGATGGAAAGGAGGHQITDSTPRGAGVSAADGGSGVGGTDGAIIRSARRGWTLAGVVRADVAVTTQERGARIAVGAVYRLGGSAEAGAAALLGRDPGAWVGGTFYVLSGALRPTVSLGVPLFFVDGVQAGVHGAVGGQLELGGRLGLRLELGAAHFPGAPAGYQETVFLPSLGIHGRI